MNPVAVMRVYPERNSSLFARVVIWRTFKEFWAARPDLRRKARGSCTGHNWYRFRHGKKRKQPIFCSVNLCLKQMGAGTTAHEFTHAAIQWANRVGLDPTGIFEETWLPMGEHARGSNDCDEERFCHALGEMYRQFNDRCYRDGIYGLVK